MRKIRRGIYVGDDGCLKRFCIKCLCKVFKNCLSSFLLIDNARFIMMMVFANLVRIYSTFLFFIVSVQEFFLMRFDVSTTAFISWNQRVIPFVSFWEGCA